MVANVASRKTRHSPGMWPRGLTPRRDPLAAVVFASAGAQPHRAATRAADAASSSAWTARGRPPLALGSAVVSGRARIDVKLSLDGVRVQSETTYAWAGPYVLSVHTVIPQPDLAIELHSTFTGHPGTPTAVAHLTLGPPGHAPVLTPRATTRGSLAGDGCVYDTRCNSWSCCVASDTNRASTSPRPSA